MDTNSMKTVEVSKRFVAQNRKAWLFTKNTAFSQYVK